jgi:hypothetical protein
MVKISDDASVGDVQHHAASQVALALFSSRLKEEDVGGKGACVCK